MLSILRHKAKLLPFVMSNLKPVVISGPSGAGKSTLLRKLFQEYPNTFAFSVSHTTRKKRDGETDGIQYHFTTVERMKEEIEKGLFVEYTNFSGNYYGTSKSAIKEVLDTNKICILDIDEQGVRNIKESDINAVFIFIKPPSMDELRRRLTSRGTETQESLERRMSTAESSISFSEKPGVYDFVLENGDLNQSYINLLSFMKQTCPNLLEKSKRYNSNDELPLAASVGMLEQASKLEAGDAGRNVCNGFSEIKLESSVAEIPLSPTRTTSDQENPAVVNVGETPLLLVNEISDVNLSESDSPAVVTLEESETTLPSDGVCGRQSWCSIS
ncbi:guanylate kinase-like [Styela clava]|uniref:guanylate kinase-like n=1 Tax=Styela clava TaxID=7725 RepID=UPI001939B9DF|nr:guanylate kinase-like [Styela clava]